MKRAVVMVCAVLAVGAIEAAQIYRVTQPDGTVEFTDDPPPGETAVAVEVPPLNTVAPLESPRDAFDDSSTTEPVKPYESVRITRPTDGESLWGPVGEVNVDLSVEPALKRGDRLDVLMDGEHVGGGSSTSITLTGVVRGTHTLVAVVRSASGKVVGQSKSVSFTKHQAQQHRLEEHRRRPERPLHTN